MKNDLVFYSCFLYYTSTNMNNQKSALVTLIIWTDGSCLKNPGPGGWAFILEDDKLEYEISCCSDGTTTNNEMELTAIVRSLEFLYSEKLLKKSVGKIIVMSDSNYSIRGINDQIDKWMAKPTDRPNWSLWKELYKLKTTINKLVPLEFKWVKAHSTNPMNNRVDKLAHARASELKHNSN